MMPDSVVLFATVILLVPMGYFLLAAPGLGQIALYAVARTERPPETSR
jgi:hypothetical protein